MQNRKWFTYQSDNKACTSDINYGCQIGIPKEMTNMGVLSCQMHDKNPKRRRALLYLELICSSDRSIMLCCVYTQWYGSAQTVHLSNRSVNAFISQAKAAWRAHHFPFWQLLFTALLLFLRDWALIEDKICYIIAPSASSICTVFSVHTPSLEQAGTVGSPSQSAAWSHLEIKVCLCCRLCSQSAVSDKGLGWWKLCFSIELLLHWLGQVGTLFLLP